MACPFEVKDVCEGGGGLSPMSPHSKILPVPARIDSELLHAQQALVPKTNLSCPAQW